MSITVKQEGIFSDIYNAGIKSYNKAHYGTQKQSTPRSNNKQSKPSASDNTNTNASGLGELVIEFSSDVDKDKVAAISKSIASTKFKSFSVTGDAKVDGSKINIEIDTDTNQTKDAESELSNFINFFGIPGKNIRYSFMQKEGRRMKKNYEDLVTGSQYVVVPKDEYDLVSFDDIVSVDDALDNVSIIPDSDVDIIDEPDCYDVCIEPDDLDLLGEPCDDDSMCIEPDEVDVCVIPDEDDEGLFGLDEENTTINGDTGNSIKPSDNETGTEQSDTTSTDNTDDELNDDTENTDDETDGVKKESKPLHEDGENTISIEDLKTYYGQLNKMGSAFEASEDSEAVSSVKALQQSIVDMTNTITTDTNDGEIA